MRRCRFLSRLWAGTLKADAGIRLPEAESDRSRGTAVVASIYFQWSRCGADAEIGHASQFWPLGTIYRLAIRPSELKEERPEFIQIQGNRSSACNHGLYRAVESPPSTTS